MRTRACLFFSVLITLTLLGTLPAAAIPGTPDKTLAASLIVPFFEVGVDVTMNSQDTLLVVENASQGTPVTIHWHLHDIDGNPSTLSGNVALVALESWTLSMRDLFNAASQAERDALTVGDFYNGFVTIDSVTAATALSPAGSPGFPFSGLNSLQGFIYYTRLAEGASNGLTMVPIEAVDTNLPTLITDFYTGGSREEIDRSARQCASLLIAGDPCATDGDGVIDEINTRVFLLPALSGFTRVVIFTWNTFQTVGLGGPSARCADDGCDQTYIYRRYDDAGNQLVGGSVRLDHVVNVFNIPGSAGTSAAGWISIREVEDPGNDFQVFPFSFNQARPPGGGQNWDAIFEGFVVP